MAERGHKKPLALYAQIEFDILEVVHPPCV